MFRRESSFESVVTVFRREIAESSYLIDCVSDLCLDKKLSHALFSLFKSYLGLVFDGET